MIHALPTDDAALLVVGSLALLIISILGLCIRAILRGELLPRKTVDAMVSERDARISAQAAALEALTATNTTLVQANATQADSISDLADAAHLQVRIGEALHKQLVQEA